MNACPARGGRFFYPLGRFLFFRTNVILSYRMGVLVGNRSDVFEMSYFCFRKSLMTTIQILLSGLQRW